MQYFVKKINASLEEHVGSFQNYFNIGGSSYQGEGFNPKLQFFILGARTFLSNRWWLLWSSNRTFNSNAEGRRTGAGGSFSIGRASGNAETRLDPGWAQMWPRTRCGPALCQPLRQPRREGPSTAKQSEGWAWQTPLKSPPRRTDGQRHLLQSGHGKPSKLEGARGAIRPRRPCTVCLGEFVAESVFRILAGWWW